MCRKRGLILNMGSFAGAVPSPMLATYSASKAFLSTYSSALAEEVKCHNILVEHVNAFYVGSSPSPPSNNPPTPPTHTHPHPYPTGLKNVQIPAPHPPNPTPIHLRPLRPLQNRPTLRSRIQRPPGHLYAVLVSCGGGLRYDAGWVEGVVCWVYAWCSYGC